MCMCEPKNKKPTMYAMLKLAIYLSQASGINCYLSWEVFSSQKLQYIYTNCEIRITKKKKKNCSISYAAINVQVQSGI